LRVAVGNPGAADLNCVAGERMLATHFWGRYRRNGEGLIEACASPPDRGSRHDCGAVGARRRARCLRNHRRRDADCPLKGVDRATRTLPRHPAFMAELRQQTGTAARCLETHDSDAVRTGEAIAARWSEIDLEARTSTVPAGRRNAGKEHIVPLQRPWDRDPRGNAAFGRSRLKALAPASRSATWP
jgi:integrase